ncbi:MAG: hypothetical protein J5767_14665 [Paludibacteraceae bacterium]|nr:hypothetical protein [Paludibacteraceae bacterium]
MDKQYELFNFQGIIAELKENHDGEENWEKFIEGVDEDSVIEDMPFYKDYLSKFDVERSFDGYNLAALEEEKLSKDDLFLLFRLIISSFSSSYEILYDKESNSIDFAISVKAGEQTITKTISELWAFQIIRMFEIYVNEQINLSIEDYDPDEMEEFEDQRKMRLMVFEKNLRRLLDQKESGDILSDLDDLLNS